MKKENQTMTEEDKRFFKDTVWLLRKLLNLLPDHYEPRCIRDQIFKEFAEQQNIIISVKESKD